MIKGLSLWQPWASLMAVGAKKFETRSWSTAWRGLVAIHAAKTWNGALRETAMQSRFRAALESECATPAGNETWQRYQPKALPRGCFVALGKLRHCLSTTRHAKLIPPESSDEFWFGNYSADRFMWVFDQIWSLATPVFARGSQGLWTLDEGVTDTVMAMLPEGVEETLTTEEEVNQ